MVVSPAFDKSKIELELIFDDVITFHSAFSQSNLNPKDSYALILSCYSVFNVEENEVIKFGINTFKLAPSGIRSFNVTGPFPESKFPTPAFAPSPTTALIFTHALSSASVVPVVTNFPFKNS